ncbi:ciliary-associated calcium-binding coiled-coil protein 1 isoform X2 [Hyperolius riggenbachi]|uniref:ciliary-associated calcium-binding coiled-coil protein 1 isoform X2 n=1 Tax=Hyperolius riggenbachi TaxID=752182 RepID=UPI0035A2EAA1
MASQEETGADLQENIHDEMKNLIELIFLSESQINSLLEEENKDDIQRTMENYLNFKDTETNLKEAVLVDYYVSGFCWGKGKNFSSSQLTAFMGLLHFLMENIETKQLSLAENMMVLTRAMAGIGHSLLRTKGKLSCFNVEQATDIIDYIKMSLFQHYKLYECMFTLPRAQLVTGAEEVVEIDKPIETLFPVPLEEGIPYEMYTRFVAPPKPEEGNSEDVTKSCGEPDKSLLDANDPLSQATIDEVRTDTKQATSVTVDSLQAEINDKLKVQEEASTAKIENLKKP